MSNHKDYTVGWICAISTEYVAAQSFLDAKHEVPEYVSPHDNNNYTLGKIGKHNVVIAVLPEGEYGISPATSVARDMLHSFPNVRIGLMVGIGGGAPSQEHDIRLGDVVVSAPWDGKGGVVYYNFGRTIQDQSFQFLNQPPMVLRTAINGLKTQYEIEGHQFEEAINSVLEKKTRLRKKYQRPSPCSDKLYKSKITHPPNNKASCAEVCSNDPLTLQPRDERAENKDNPAIHYGLIASANQLMQDALLRDKFAKEHKVLCFETEAAGLMNQFPCLVIRGICDYSDTHKNKEWQGYAAMAAAAYTKDLLSQIHPNRVEAERKIIDVLNSVKQNVDEMHCSVKDLALIQRQERVSFWLSPPDPSTNYNKALRQRHQGTGLWLLQSSAFKEWQKQRDSFLWLYGIPGCGKTILSSTIIEHLESSYLDQPVLYFYFDFNDSGKQTLENVVRSLIGQLYRMHKDTRKHLDLLFSSCGHRQPSCESLCRVLSQMMDQVNEIWIVLDALDECCTRKGTLTEGLLLWIQGLLHLEQRNVHLLVTSRPVHDIQLLLSDLAQKEEDIVPIQSNLIRDDIRRYIHTQVREGNGLKRWRSYPDILDEIESQLMKKANGMFRWAACQIDALENCLDYRTLKNALASLPATLDETYSRILKAIPSEHKLHAIRILQLLTFSKRPLRIEETVDAIAVETEGERYFDPIYRMPDPQEISRICSSLVIMVPITGNSHDSKDEYDSDREYDLDEEYVELQLAHFSVKEYLTSNRLDNDISQNFQELTARASIAKICLAYLLHFDRVILPSEIKKAFPFAQYAATYWMAHARVAENKDSRLLVFIEQFFCYQERSAKICYSLCCPDQPWKNVLGNGLNEPGSALYYAALGGFLNAVKCLLSQGADVNAQGGEYNNALQAAIVGGHKQVMKLLIENGASVNAPGGSYGNPLYAASKGGYEQVVKLLINKGANVNVRCRNYGSALWAASVGGHQKIVQLLLDVGANVNKGESFDNALKAASSSGHKQVVQSLLDAGANVNEGGNFDNALQAASEAGHEQIVQLLLLNGADVNAQGGHLGSALQAASSQGYERVVKLLLANDADVNAQHREYSNARPAYVKEQNVYCHHVLYAASAPGYKLMMKQALKMDIEEKCKCHSNALQAASAKGYEQIVQLLLVKGANVNAQGGDYGNALQAASSRGYKQIVQLLLNEGADVNAQGGDFGNALQAASSGGYKQIVQLLLNEGADVNAQGGDFGNALQAASSGGYKQVVQLLLDEGAEVNAQGGKFSNALQAASSSGHGQVVQLLLDEGADVNAQGGEYDNALQAAIVGGHEQVMKLLINKGASVNAPAGIYGNALYAASEGGYEQVVKLLIAKGANVNVLCGNEQCRIYGNALQAASEAGHNQVVKLLLKNNADINAQGGRYGSALQAASFGRRKQVVQLLLNKGADVNAQGGKFGNALQAASLRGPKQLVKLLLDNGAHINAQGGYFDNALQAASRQGLNQVAKLLFDKGAHVNSQVLQTTPIASTMNQAKRQRRC